MPVAAQTYDAVVVGGGPAGCHATRGLAGRGLSVLLLEGSRFPRWKPCAGGITRKTGPYLAPELRALFEREIDGSHLTFGEGHDFHVRMAEPIGWMVHRERFDEVHFRSVAALPGVDAREGCRVTALREGPDGVEVESSGGRFRARAAVGADGVAGVTARLVRPRATRRLGVAYEGELRFERPELTRDALFDFSYFPRGYGWIFPKGDHYSIGGYVAGGKSPGLKELYGRFRRECGRLRGCTDLRTRGHGVPQGGCRDVLHSRRVVLAGDAADTVDPLTGEGIYYAFRTGHLAAGAVADLLAEGRPLAAYSRAVQREIHADLRWARRMARLVYRFPRLAYEVLLRNPLACRWTAELLAGRRTYRRVMAESLRCAPLLPFLLLRPRRREAVFH